MKMVLFQIAHRNLSILFAIVLMQWFELYLSRLVLLAFDSRVITVTKGLLQYKLFLKF